MERNNNWELEKRVAELINISLIMSKAIAHPDDLPKDVSFGIIGNARKYLDALEYSTMNGYIYLSPSKTIKACIVSSHDAYGWEIKFSHV